MKLVNLLAKLKFITVVFLLLTQTVIPVMMKARNSPSPNSEIESKKLLFMYKYPLVKKENSHKLNVFTYKNVLFSNEQLVYFQSTNEQFPEKDEDYDTTKYLLTMRYEFIDLPCLNKSYVCLHSQFAKEYREFYPELDFNVPNEILEKFGDMNKASKQCIVIMLEPVQSLSKAVWICHLDLKAILDVQVELSHIIQAAKSMKYEFVAEYVRSRSSITRGIATLTKEKLIFMDMKKKALLGTEWKEIEGYSSANYLKDKLEWKGAKSEEPDSDKCLKVVRTEEVKDDSPDFFCINYMRNDLTQKHKLVAVLARFSAEMYANMINLRLQAALVKQSLEKLSKSSQTKLDVDSKLLLPLKMEVRRKHLMARYEFQNKVKTGEKSRAEEAAVLKKAAKEEVEKVCGGIELCKRAMEYCIDKGLLPLTVKRQKFAMDMQNPYHPKMPKTNIRIDPPKSGSKGEGMLKAVAKMKGSKDYFAEEIPESASGQVPNSTAIKKAFNTFHYLSEKKIVKSAAELMSNCKLSDRANSNNIRRKVGFLALSGKNDVFFEYLGAVRDFQLNKK